MDRPDSGAEAPPVLVIENLSAGYGDRTVLNQLELSVPEGEIFGLLGPNGSGKTTVMRAICGRVRAIAGAIRVGPHASTARAAQRLIGVVPQEIGLYPHLTVRENLHVFGRLAGLSRKATVESIPGVLEAVQMSTRADDRVETLSGGLQRRANIAASILHEPSLILLDEPTVGVDIDARNGLHEVIRQISRHHVAILLTTHDMEQAQILCDRVGFMYDGRLSPCGAPAELLRDRYAEQHDIVVSVQTPVSDEQGALLSRLGFHRSLNELEWRALMDVSPESQFEFHSKLQEAGFDVREIRFRRPGLDHLFLDLNAERAVA